MANHPPDMICLITLMTEENISYLMITVYCYSVTIYNALVGERIVISTTVKKRFSKVFM